MLDIWHLRLGHPSKQSMKFFTFLNKAIPATFNSECDTCHLAKHKRLPFPISLSVSEYVFDLLHMDVWGPFPVESLYGHFYFLTIVDDKSRFVWVYPMIQKSEVRSLIVSFCQLVQTQFSKIVKCIRTDNAKEFDMINFFREKGIVHQNSCVHTPQQNSVVERKHQHLLVVARALRLQASLPLSFWADCVLHAASLVNITPTPILHNKTPYEVLFNSTPDFSTLKVFGCLAYASVLPKPKTKMDPKAVRCVFIGHPKNMKGYRLFSLDTKEVFVSRDVAFCEHSFPFQKQVVLPVSDNNAGVDIFLHRNKMKSCCPGMSSRDVSLNSTTDALETAGSYSSVSQQQDVQPEQIIMTDFQQHNNAQPSDEYQNSNQEHSLGSLDINHNTSSLPLEVLSDSIKVLARPTRVRHLPPKFRDYQVSLPKAMTSPHIIVQIQIPTPPAFCFHHT
ncbi:hypothetical protein GQ457_01G012580 [Hibiscus cannabinus]